MLVSRVKKCGTSSPSGTGTPVISIAATEEAKVDNERWVDVDTVPVHVREDGQRDGPPLVLVHGFLGSMHWFDRLTPLLAGEFRVIRTDLLGHGRTGRSRRGYTPDDQARTLFAVLRRLGVRDAAVLGHCLGSDIAIALAEQCNGVSALALVNEGPDATVAMPKPVNKVLRLPGVGRLLYRSLPSSVVDGFFAPDYDLGAAFEDPDRIVADVCAVSYDCFRDTQIGKERYVAESPLDARLRLLGIPALVVFGEQDQIYRSAESATRYRAVPGTRVETIATAGHSPILETPHLVADTLRSFIKDLASQ